MQPVLNGLPMVIYFLNSQSGLSLINACRSLVFLTPCSKSSSPWSTAVHNNRSTSLQMIDKVWSDWQHRHPQNFWAYAGGSVPTITDFKQYVQFPNGAPSFMNVSFVPLYSSHSVDDSWCYSLILKFRVIICCGKT